MSDLNATPTGDGLAALPTAPASPSIPGYWLCQFDVRVDLPSDMAPTNMEAFLAGVLANALHLNGQPGNAQVTLIATSTGSVANPTTPAAVAIPTPVTSTPTAI